MLTAPTSAFSTIFINLFFLFLSFCTPYCYTNADHFHKGSFMSKMCICNFKIVQTTTTPIHLIKSPIKKRYYKGSIWCSFTAIHCITLLGHESTAHNLSYYYTFDLQHQTINVCKVASLSSKWFTRQQLHRTCQKHTLLESKFLTIRNQLLWTSSHTASDFNVDNRESGACVLKIIIN